MAVIKSGASTDQMSVDATSKAARVTLYDTAGNVLSVGGGTQYTEDAVAAANPIGNAINLIRTDTPAGQVSADGDNVAQRGTNFGAAYVQIVTSAGAYVDAFSGGTQYTEDVPAAADPIGTALNLIRKDTLAGLVSADGDNVAARGTDKGELYVKHVDTIPATQSGTWTVQPGNTANTTAWKVDGSAVTQPVSAATLPLPTGASTAAKQPALGTAGTASADVITVQGIAGMTKILVTPDSVALPANQSVNVAQINGVTPLMGNGASGTGAPRVTIANDSTGILAQVTLVPTVTTVSTVTTLSTLTGGGVAHDGIDSGNPIKIGAKAETSPKGITLVADGDRTDLYADADGILIVKTGTAYGDLQSERISNTDGASTAFSTFGATANLRNFVTQITVHNAHATTSGFVDIRDGTAGAVLWTIPLPATGGATIHFNPPLRQPTANTALAYDVSAAITTIYISVNGFQSKA